MVEFVSGNRKLKKGERVEFNPFRPASQGAVVKEADVEKKFQADKKASAAAQAKGGTLKSVATSIGTGINNVLGITPPERKHAPSYKMPDKAPTPVRPAGPASPKRAPSTAPAVTAKKSAVATPKRFAAGSKTISNVNSSDRATGNPYSSGYGSSRQAGGWGAGNKPKKGVGRSTGGSFGKSFKGLKWFNGKD